MGEKDFFFKSIAEIDKQTQNFIANSSDKSLVVILTNYYKRNHSKHCLVTIRESLQRYPHRKYYLRSHSKQFLETIIRESFQTILTNVYQRNHGKDLLKLPAQKSLQKIQKIY